MVRVGSKPRGGAVALLVTIAIGLAGLLVTRLGPESTPGDERREMTAPRVIRAPDAWREGVAPLPSHASPEPKRTALVPRSAASLPTAGVSPERDVARIETITVCTVDPDGSPVPEARVDVLRDETLVGSVQTDARGEATVALDRLSCELRASHATAGTSGALRLVWPWLEIEERMLITLRRRSEVIVDVTFADGSAAEGAMVTLMPRRGAVAAREELKALTGPSGRVRIEVEGGLDYICRVRWEEQWGVGPWALTVAPGTEHRIESTLPGRFVIQGVLRRPSGSRVGLGDVLVWRAQPGLDLDGGELPVGPSWHVERESDDEGRFVVGVPGPGDYVLLARLYRRTPGSVVELRVSEAEPVQWVDVSIPRDDYIRGDVVDSGGAPVSGVRLWARPASAAHDDASDHGPTLALRWGVDSGRSRDDGSFSLGRLQVGRPFIVSASWKGESPADIPRRAVARNVVLGTEKLTLVLDGPPLAESELLVLLSADGRPLVEGHVELFVQGTKGFARTGIDGRPSPHGGFRFSGLRQGHRYALRADAPGRAAFETELVLFEAGLRVIDVELPTTGSLEVRVEHMDGTDCVDCPVWLRHGSGLPGEARSERQWTDARGQTVFPDLDPGPWDVDWFDPVITQNDGRVAEVESGRRARITLRP